MDSEKPVRDDEYEYYVSSYELYECWVEYCTKYNLDIFENLSYKHVVEFIDYNLE